MPTFLPKTFSLSRRSLRLTASQIRDFLSFPELQRELALEFLDADWRRRLVSLLLPPIPESNTKQNTLVYVQEPYYMTSETGVKLHPRPYQDKNLFGRIRNTEYAVLYAADFLGVQDGIHVPVFAPHTAELVWGSTKSGVLVHPKTGKSLSYPASALSLRMCRIMTMFTDMEDFDRGWVVRYSLYLNSFTRSHVYEVSTGLKLSQYFSVLCAHEYEPELPAHYLPQPRT